MALFETTFPPVVAFGSRTLSGGETGTDVAVLQTVYDEMLKVMNPPQGPIGPPVPVTGTYDPATVQAVRNVQAYFGLAVNGVVGPETYFAFGQGTGPNATYGGPAYGSRTLAIGAQGGDVTVLQNRLNCFRYSSALGGPADGVYGPKTAAAVQQFQSDAVANGDTGLAVDGTVGPNTLDATWIYTYAGGRGLFQGRNGFDVAFVQVILKGLGFYGGAVDGYYGPSTQAAVAAFQRANGIATDGVVGPQTFHAIGQNNTVTAPGPLPVPPIGPPTPSEVSCCFTLDRTPEVQGVAEGAAFVHNGPSSGPSAVPSELLVAALLAPPSTYGSQYTKYGVNTTMVFQPMTLCQSLAGDGGVWTYVLTSPSIPTTSVNLTIAPLTDDGRVGPVIAFASGTCALPGPVGGGGSSGQEGSSGNAVQKRENR